MNMLRKLFLLGIIILLSAFEVKAQSLTELENKFEHLTNVITENKNSLDSLKKIIDERGKRIDIEKSKSNPDKDKIVNLMASSVTVSNNYDQLQNKIEEDEKEYEQLKNKLDNKYSAIIDSLNEIKPSTGKIEEIRLIYIQKRLLVAPQIPLLSFNPEKIAEIDLSKLKDKKEKSLYKDYLKNALTEVDSVLNKVKNLSNDFNQIVRLQKKTQKFLEETEFNTNIQVQNYPGNQANERVDVTNSGFGNNRKSNIVAVANSYNLILNQLNIYGKNDLKNVFNFSEDLNKNGLNVEEYNNLLKEVKNRLQEYKLAIANKINSSK